MKIAVLLPYKENFSVNYAGAVSLFVKDTIIHSRFKKSTFVFGNMDYKKPFLKNYINVQLNKNILQSKSKNYIKNFINYFNYLWIFLFNCARRQASIRSPESRRAS